jgi:hypothetical protein
MEVSHPSSSDPPARDGRGDEGQTVNADNAGKRGAPGAGPPSARELDAFVDALQDKDPDSRRFSMWGLLGIVTAASLILSLGSYFPKPAFAGIVGIATLVSMVGLSAMKNPPAVLQAAWWVLLLIYLMSIASAVWG